MQLYNVLAPFVQQPKGKVQDISYLKTLDQLLNTIYSGIDESELPNIIDICRSRSSSILKEIQSALGLHSIMGGEQEVNFKELYGDTKNLTRPLIESYRNAADVLLAAIKDDKLSTLEQRMKNAIPAIFLFRHAIELALKALLLCICPRIENPKHDLTSAWEKVREGLESKNWFNIEICHRVKICDQVNHTLALLKICGLDKSEEFFRYLEAKPEGKDLIALIDCEPFNLYGVCSRLGEIIDRFDHFLLKLYEEEWQAKHAVVDESLSTT